MRIETHYRRTLEFSRARQARRITGAITADVLLRFDFTYAFETYMRVGFGPTARRATR